MAEGLVGQGAGRGAQRSLVALAFGLGVVSVAVALVVCAGWALDRVELRNLIAGFPEMKLNAALAFILCGLSLTLLADGNVRHALGVRACALAVVVLAALTLIEYITHVDLGIDQLLVVDHAMDSPTPGRIPLFGAVNFLLLGCALALVDSRTATGRWPAQTLALTVASVAFVMVLGFAYDAGSLYRPRASAPVALHGMILFLLLGLGVLCARPHRGIMARALSSDAGGVLVRRLLPAAIIIPPVLGWLRLQGEQAGWFDANLGVAMYATTNVAIFSLLIWTTAESVGRADHTRSAAEQKVRGQLARLDLLSHITRAIGERQDVHSVFQVVVRSLEDNLPIDFGSIALYDPAAEILTVECVGVRSSSLAMELALPERARIPVDENGLTRCLSGVLVYEPDITHSPFPFPARLERGGLRSLVFAPLRSESSVFGVLIVARRQSHAFSSGECEFLLQLSEHVALAARQSQLHGALQTAYDDLRQSQETVLQQERLRSLGQMASGIAHDINNALSPAALYTEALLDREPNLSDTARDQLTTIYRAIDDVAGTVARMREFYRPREPQLQLANVDLNRLANQVADLTRARWRDQQQERGVVIELRMDLQPGLPGVMAAETEIRDALINLVFNAVDAMPDGGTLTMRTRGLRGRDPDRDPSTEAHVCVEIGDTGTGMSEETQARCLEPFYTTKGERGTGLGLAMVYGMVQRHSAELEIASAVGKGTTVRLVFPTAADDFTASLTLPIQPVTERMRLLVIDDDPMLIKSLQDTLECEGHFVTVADGGQAGVQAFLDAQLRGQPFSAVITDLGMPYFDGSRVAAAIRAAAEHVPIILLTGWGERLISENDIPPDVDRVLAKPPKLRVLRATLAELTARRRASANSA